MKAGLKKELVWFVFSGGLAVLTDFICYFFLKNYMSEDVAKGISFCIGAGVAFLLNKYFTFNKREKSNSEIVKFAFLYTCTFFVNVYANKISIEILHNYFIAFLIATGCSTIINFIGQKFWVFK